MNKAKDKNYSCQSKIENANHIFTTHTGNMSNKQSIISEIFEEGRFVATREIEYQVRDAIDDSPIRYDFLSEFTRNFHQDIADEIKALFTVSSKIEKRDAPEAHYQLAVIFLNKNFLDEAEKHFKLAIQRKPAMMRAHLGLSIIKMKYKKYDDAIMLLENSKDIGANYPDYHNLMGVGYLLKSNYSKAINCFKRAVEINPNYAESQFNLGVAIFFSAMSGVNNEKAIGLPARVTIYLKQIMVKNKYKTFGWQNRFKEIMQILKTNDHNMIKNELIKFTLEIANLASEKDKIYEFFLRFMYGGRDLTSDHIESFQNNFDYLLEEFPKYPDVWNDIGIFNLVKSRVYLIKAIETFYKASSLQKDSGEGQINYNLIKGKEKGFLLLLRAILKDQH